MPSSANENSQNDERFQANSLEVFVIQDEKSKSKLSYDKDVMNTSCDKDKSDHYQEKWFSIFVQIIIPFIIAGFGMVGAGLLLNEVQDWDLFQNVSDIIILVPALLGLKGNLEMTLAARLSTQVNIGLVNDRKTIKLAILGNLILDQLQSITIGLLASLIACLTAYIKEKRFNAINLLIMIGSSIMTASVTCLILGTIVMFIIIFSKKFKLNPDNIATPIAASLGDIVTLAILSGIGTMFLKLKDHFWFHIIVIVIYLLVIPFLVIYCKKNFFVKEALRNGWLPIILAMLISTAAGILLDFSINEFNFKGVASFQPVINGIGGNIVGVYASKLSTALHRTSKMGTKASWAPESFFFYFIDSCFGKSNIERRTSFILISCIIPGHLLFFFTIFFLEKHAVRPDLSFLFVFFYIIFAFIQVLILMFLCYFLVHIIWKLNKNPDNYCIPLLTGSGDFLGVLFLLLCFYFAYIAGNTSLKVVTPEPSQILNSTTINYNWNETTYYTNVI